MTWIDAAIVVVLLFFIVTAFQNGLIREIISIAAAIGGVVLAGLFYDEFSDAFLGSIDNETTKNVVSFMVIFAGITILGQLVAILVHPAIVIMQLGIADQLLGAVFGAVKGFVIIEALLILMVTYPRYDLDEKINDSEFAPRLLEVAEPLTAILPEEFDASVGQFTDGGPIITPSQTQ
jgi:membrane protein required for colicin V production